MVDDVYRRNLLSAAQEKIMKINQENSGTQLSVHNKNIYIAALESFDLAAFTDFIKRDCNRNFKWPSMQRWQSQIYNGTLKTLTS